MSDMRISGPLAVAGAAVLWGTAGTAGALALGEGAGVAPESLAAARLVIGGIALALAAVPLLAGRVRPGGAWRQLAIAAVAVAGYQLAFFAAVDRSGVAISTVVAIGSGPVFTGALTWLLDRTPPTPRWIAATTAAVVGCAVLLTGGGAQAGGQVVSGVLFALLCGLLYAFYAIAAARLIRSGIPSGAVMGLMFGGAAVIMLPVLLATDTAWMATPSGLATALYLGCATTALAYILYGIGLRTTPVATAMTLTLAEPAVAALLGVAVLGERLTATSIAGLVLLGIGLIVVALPAASPQTAESSA